MSNIKCYTVASEATSEISVLQVSSTENGFFIEFSGKSLEFDKRLLQFIPDMANVFEGYHGLFLVWSSGNACDKSGYASAIFRNRLFENNHIGSIFVDAEGNPYFFTRYPCKPTEGTEVDIVEYNAELGTRAEDVFVRTLPKSADYDAWNQRHRAKINFLGHISTNDSLTMLESQLDLVTKILLNMAPESEEKTALEEATKDSSVFSIHDLSKIKQTVERQKAYIRAEQKKYFEARGTAKNVDLSS